MTLSLSSIWSNFSLSTMARGSKGCSCGRYWGTPKVFGRGMPPIACPLVAYSRRGSKLARLWSWGTSCVSPWVKGPMLDQIRVVGSQWVWEWSYRHFHQERVQHWVVYNREASHMVGRNACSGPAQNRGHPFFPMLRLPSLPYPRLDGLLDWG